MVNLLGGLFENGNNKLIIGILKLTTVRVALFSSNIF